MPQPEIHEELKDAVARNMDEEGVSNFSHWVTLDNGHVYHLLGTRVADAAIASPKAKE